ncbi:FecR domain-containing protein [Pantoea sp. 18069]|uniref:FecR domain-containing protein n=1 Tax=Pantoea sp. 18069 TaxID=2681415 RepID=UPI00135A0541|nr:FecR domain-containing protein [Pantoea sp. 18069]
MTRAPGRAAAHEIPQEVARRAVEWMLELQSAPVTPALRQAWTDWRAAHPAHEAAWQRIESVRQRFGGASGATAVAHATLGAGAHSRRRAVKALAVLLFAGGAARTVEQRTPWRQWAADHRTRPGEQRRILLADGSTLMLNTDTAVDVRFGPTERRLVLLRGEIFMVTAKDPGRRFLVEMPQGLAEALGTQFTAHTAGDRAVVRVFEGAVEITPAAAAAPAQILQAGQGAGFTAQSVDTPQPVADADKSWVQGTLIAKSMRLADLLAQLSRYSPHPIVCSDAVAELRVSGAYPVAQIPLILESLSATLQLQIETQTRFGGRQVVQVRLAARDA